MIEDHWIARILVGVALVVVVLIVVGMATYGPWVRRCEYVAHDVIISTNGGCDDPNVHRENEELYRDYFLAAREWYACVGVEPLNLLPDLQRANDILRANAWSKGKGPNIDKLNG